MIPGIVAGQMRPTPSGPTPPAIGAYWDGQGGYYAGKISLSGVTYALVVAPKATGQSATTLQWNGDIASTAGTLSLVDGAANTAAALASGRSHPAAEYCAALVIDGFDDWYLPARSELEVVYRNLKPSTSANATGTGSGTNTAAVPPTGDYTSGSPTMTAATAFQTGGAEAFAESTYWSSTQTASFSASAKSFFNGYEEALYKNNTHRVRAIRKVAV